MQFYFKAQSQHGHRMLQLAVELARIRSFFGDESYLLFTKPVHMSCVTWRSMAVSVVDGQAEN